MNNNKNNSDWKHSNAASSFLSLEGGVDVIEALWKEMKEIDLIRETTYGCFRLSLNLILGITFVKKGKLESSRYFKLITKQ